jgi:hypothetical protein
MSSRFDESSPSSLHGLVVWPALVENSKTKSQAPAYIAETKVTEEITRVLSMVCDDCKSLSRELTNYCGERYLVRV